MEIYLEPVSKTVIVPKGTLRDEAILSDLPAVHLAGVEGLPTQSVRRDKQIAQPPHRSLRHPNNEYAGFLAMTPENIFKIISIN